MRSDLGGCVVQEEALHTVIVGLISLHEICERILHRLLSSYMMSKLYMICGIGDARGLPSSNPQYEVGARECTPHPFRGS